MAYKDNLGIYHRDASKKMIDKIIQKGRNRWTFMSTGLVDKHGNLIYEGDILKVKNQQKEFYAVVDFEPTWKKYIGRVFDGNRGNNNVSLCGINVEIEIIGNVYENPELLSKLNKEKK